MKSNNSLWLLWGFLGLAVLISLILVFRPASVAVDIVTVEIAPMQLTVGDEGETRVKDVFVVSAPVNGRLRRIETEPGDTVVAGQTLLAELEPVEAELLDPRSRAQAQAQLNAAEAAESLAEAQLKKAEADLEFARSEWQRATELSKVGTVSERELEASTSAYKGAKAALSVAEAAMQVRRFELARAKAQLMSPQEQLAARVQCDCIFVTSPVDGRVLRVFRESEGFVRAGEGLVEIGNPAQLEIVVDLLSVDAVKVRAGQTAYIENWGGEGRLEARVKRVEPFGFTKISALGIEEQRVNVVLDITSDYDLWQHLGHGYQVDVRVVLWQQDAVLQVPLTALFRDKKQWTLFVAKNGEAQKRGVEVGHMTDKTAQILDGLSEGEEIVLYPSEGVEDGVAITTRD
ncbi:HlyD family efflux transporter periplasmic adaptor subunit [Aliiglaciecola sp. CAU 1673]|uniref:efflux RND transporter periplasmic adaptor subunit n=1 Tax=Aliiglaciecola sp. CAU 1673 TaxID=3032595 RepID=UPI0023DCD8F1|nr:HlyD family efflux transporter periplasmic adaptor subunit [Aliiglaciecola sp. CAU 1673]MDF2179975.1 HlyD family efflux transporter periplasmic adaptor subunit [Aliiglaciecola sp. CAU 1673]